MKISCRKKTALNSKKDAVLIPVFRNMRQLKPLTGKKIEDEINNMIASDYFSYEEKEFNSFFMEVGGKLKKIFLVTVAKEPEDYRYYTQLGASFVKILRKERIASFSLLAFEDIYMEKRDNLFTKSFLDGFMFGLYSFDSFKSKVEKSYHFEEAEVITAFTKLKRFVDENADSWNSTFQAVYLAKDLINTPPADMTPEIFADRAKEMVSGKLSVEVVDDLAVLEEEYPLVYAVGKGSSNLPRSLKLDYKGNPDSEQHVALVGKGVTFDSGGTNLKPSGFIEDMKCDMSGAATVLAVTKLAHDTDMKVNIITYIPLVENTIGT